MILVHEGVHDNIRKLFSDALGKEKTYEFGLTKKSYLKLNSFNFLTIYNFIYFFINIKIKKQKIQNIDLYKIPVGKYIIATYIRQTRDYNLNSSKIRNRLLLLKIIWTSLNVALNSINFCQSNKIFEVIMHDKGYTPCGELMTAAILNGIKPIEVVAGHKSNSLMIRRNTATTKDEHPASISKDLFQKEIKNISQKEIRLTKEEIKKSYISGDWYSEVGTQKNADNNKPFTLPKADEYRHTAGIFPHIFYDSTFFYGIDIFKNYFEWFSELIRFAENKKDTLWLIKSHPANVVKDYRQGTISKSEKEHIEEILGYFPAHFIFIPSDTPIATPKIIDKIDYVFTVRGTVGLESALKGKIVFTAGTGRYDGLGFTVDSTTPNEYFNNIHNTLKEKRKMKLEEINLALCYSYLLFIKRPFPLKGLIWQYQKENKFNLYSKVEDISLYQNDINRLKKWLNSKNLEFLL